METAGIECARRRARRLLKLGGVESMHHVVVESIAERLDVRVVVAPLEGATSQLLVSGGRARILISDRVTSTRVRRYAIAHELGHHVLRHPCPAVAGLCSPTGHREERSAEDEADAFAQELLMPQAVVHAWCEDRQMTLEPVRELALICAVPLAMSASRIIRATKHAGIALLSNAKGVLWSSSSPEFVRMYGSKPVATAAPGRCSLAGRILHQGERPGPELVPATTWLDVVGEPPLLEHSLPGDTPETVITTLWACHREAADVVTLAEKTPFGVIA